jgi:hypothetical protein
MAEAYTNGWAPKGYRCGNCGANGCRLWREYGTLCPGLLCADCAERDQGKRLVFSNSDTIGWYVPAVPTADDAGWWGYTSVPDAGVAWWKALPTRPDREVPRG